MADAASAAAGAEHASAGLPQFDLGQWPGQMVWMLIVFGVMLILFARVFVPKVGGTIAAREDKIVQQAVVWGDMDSYAHVNNVVYFRYFENARLEYFRRLDSSVGLYGVPG